ncbi:A/G-specific adenine glycosylase [Frigidibacter sp. RF13]|uniref:A/G-specific adenine glycosylase n=1 Tax=Frigidibacter sp. RF13 TaxID=2997340 RepID=UPI00226EBDE3|nr:A/G-specific adenine glycosylase [Frigidibacter sp. RF13]MCY1126534.1 A/G-specific adenine glycosylase [Frigidibacter sp. RF13]
MANERVDTAAVGEALLGWYDRSARTMPWRTGPEARARGERPDPYRVWLSEVMLQQTTVAAVNGYFNRFTALWPSVANLAAARDEEVMAEWAGLGYYARARNLLKCARAVVDRHEGQFPAELETLLALPGIGPYTAAAVAAIAFDRPATVVDGNVERVVARLFAIETPLPKAKPELQALAARLTPDKRPGDHAQAMMDLGATICTPRSPACVLCPVTERCLGRRAGIAADLPRRLPKPEKPERRGFAYVVCRADGAVLLERRAEKGLLGGMLGWPTSEWSADPVPAPPVAADWQTQGMVRHTFTHFHLTLTVLTATVPQGANPDRGFFLPSSEFDPVALPTVMLKVHDAASPASAPIERKGRRR